MPTVSDIWDAGWWDATSAFPLTEGGGQSSAQPAPEVKREPEVKIPVVGDKFALTDMSEEDQKILLPAVIKLAPKVGDGGFKIAQMGHPLFEIISELWGAPFGLVISTVAAWKFPSSIPASVQYVDPKVIPWRMVIITVSYTHLTLPPKRIV